MVIRTGGPSSDETTVLDLPGVREECRAENCRWKHPHKRFCPQGHDTFEVGRASGRACRACQAEYGQSEKYKAAKRKYQQGARGRLTDLIYRGERSQRELEAKFIELVGGSHD